MKIHIFVGKSQDEEEVYEIVGAWDEWTMDANYDGYQEALKKEREKYPGEIREAIVEVPDGFFERVFPPPPEVKGEVVAE